MPLLHPMHLSVFHLGTVQPADPIPGANLIEVLYFGRVEILSATATLTTSAAAANRYIGALFSVAGLLPAWSSFSPLAQTASLTHIYTWQRGIAPFFNALDPSGYTTIGFGTNIMVNAVAELAINVVNIQAADRISDVSIVYASWPDPRFPV